MSNPWLLTLHGCLPRLFAVTREARDQIVTAMRTHKNYWDKLWEERDHGQDARHVHSVGLYPITHYANCTRVEGGRVDVARLRGNLSQIRLIEDKLRQSA